MPAFLWQLMRLHTLRELRQLRHDHELSDSDILAWAVEQVQESQRQRKAQRTIGQAPHRECPMPDGFKVCLTASLSQCGIRAASQQARRQAYRPTPYIFTLLHVSSLACWLWFMALKGASLFGPLALALSDPAQDRSLASGLFLLELMAAVEPRVVNWTVVAAGTTGKRHRVASQKPWH